MSDEEIKNRIHSAIELLEPITQEGHKSWLDKKFGIGYTNRKIKRIEKSLKQILEEDY